MAAVNESVEFVDHQAVQIRQEKFFAVTTMLHAVNCTYKAVNSTSQLLSLNFMALARVQPEVSQWNLILKWFECD